MLRLDFGELGLPLVEKPRRIGFALTDDLRVLHVGFEQRVLRGKPPRLAIGCGLPLRGLRFLQLVDARFDDRDALRELVELGCGEVAPRRRGGLTGRKADQLLLEKIELGRPRAALGGHRCAARVDEHGIGIAGLSVIGILQRIERLLLDRLLLTRRGRARAHLAQAGLELVEIRLDRCRRAVGRVERLLGLAERQLIDAFRELFLARFLLQRLELLLGFGNAFGGALAGFLEPLGGCGTRRRRLEMP